MEVLHIYTRVSQRIQEEGTSLDYQRELGEKCALELGFRHELHNEGVHTSSSENPMDRDVLRRLLARVENGEVRHLFVYNQDRLSRNDIAWTTIKVILIKNEVVLHTPNGRISFENPMDRLLFGVVSEISAYENALRSERTRQGKLRRLREGKIWKGGPPNFGYSIVDKELVPNDEEIVWLEKMYEMYANGKPLSAIRMELIANGVLTRRGNAIWNDRSVDVILGAENNCEIYAGSYTYKDKKSGEVITCQSPSILPMKLIERVRKERLKRNEMRVPREVDKNFYLLREMLVCDECNSKMWGRIFKDQNRSESFYFCKSAHDNYRYKNTKPKKNCKLGNISLTPMEDIVWESVIRVLEKSNLFKEEVKAKVFDEDGSMDEQRKVLDNKRKQVGRQKSKLSKENQLLALLKEDERELKDTIHSVSLKIIELEKDIEESELWIAKTEEKVRWIDWVGQFSSKIDDLRQIQLPKERKDLLEGVLTKIGVRKVSTRERSIKLHFKYPYVNDSFSWVDEKNKSSGYDITGGEYTVTLGAEIIRVRGKKTEMRMIEDDKYPFP